MRVMYEYQYTLVLDGRHKDKERKKKLTVNQKLEPTLEKKSKLNELRKSKKRRKKASSLHLLRESRLNR